MAEPKVKDVSIEQLKKKLKDKQPSFGGAVSTPQGYAQILAQTFGAKEEEVYVGEITPIDIPEEMVNSITADLEERYVKIKKLAKRGSEVSGNVVMILKELNKSQQQELNSVFDDFSWQHILEESDYNSIISYLTTPSRISNSNIPSSISRIDNQALTGPRLVFSLLETLSLGMEPWADELTGNKSYLESFQATYTIMVKAINEDSETGEFVRYSLVKYSLISDYLLAKAQAIVDQQDFAYQMEIRLIAAMFLVIPENREIITKEEAMNAYQNIYFNAARMSFQLRNKEKSGKNNFAYTPRIIDDNQEWIKKLQDEADRVAKHPCWSGGSRAAIYPLNSISASKWLWRMDLGALLYNIGSVTSGWQTPANILVQKARKSTLMYMYFLPAIIQFNNDKANLVTEIIKLGFASTSRPREEIELLYFTDRLIDIKQPNQDGKKLANKFKFAVRSVYEDFARGSRFMTTRQKISDEFRAVTNLPEYALILDITDNGTFSRPFLVCRSKDSFLSLLTPRSHLVVDKLLLALGHKENDWLFTYGTMAEMLKDLNNITHREQFCSRLLLPNLDARFRASPVVDIRQYMHPHLTQEELGVPNKNDLFLSFKLVPNYEEEQLAVGFNARGERPREPRARRSASSPTQPSQALMLDVATAGLL